MNPYSHLVIASKLETLVDPTSKPEYYWGAIAPDVRYLAAVRREQTHFAPQRINALISEYPHLKSFLQGCLVHCLCDELALEKVFFHFFPFALFKGRMSRRRTAVVLELYYLEFESIGSRIAGTHNEVLSAMGINEALSIEYAKHVSSYATSSSPESRLSNLLKLMGLENEDSAGRYVSTARRWYKSHALNKLLFLGVNMGKISEQVVSKVASRYQHCSP